MKIRFMGYVLILSVALKLAGVTHWSWGITLIPLWIGLSGAAIDEFVRGTEGLAVPKLTEAEQALLDLADGSFYYWQEIQQHTGFDEEHCKEILAVINKIKKLADS
jgi:hypothetical protein